MPWVHSLCRPTIYFCGYANFKFEQVCFTNAAFIHLDHIYVSEYRELLYEQNMNKIFTLKNFLKCVPYTEQGQLRVYCYALINTTVGVFNHRLHTLPTCKGSATPKLASNQAHCLTQWLFLYRQDTIDWLGTIDNGEHQTSQYYWQL